MGNLPELLQQFVRAPYGCDQIKFVAVFQPLRNQSTRHATWIGEQNANSICSLQTVRRHHYPQFGIRFSSVSIEPPDESIFEKYFFVDGGNNFALCSEFCRGRKLQ